MVFEEIKSDKGNAALKAVNDITIHNIKEAFSELNNFWQKYRNIAVDLSEVHDFDSAGFQLLLQFKKEAVKNDRVFRLLNHSAEILKILDLYGATGIFGDKISLKKEQRNRFDFNYGMNKIEGVFV